MADIFISYKREDRKTTKALADALEKRRFSTWWDTRLATGESYDDVIETALDSAQCVIVLWSQAAVKSRWVRTEAGEGLEREILVLVFIEDVKPPLAFRRIHTASLVGWEYALEGPLIDALVRDVKRIVATSGVAQKRKV
ncbi:MAG: toll/interleukin-1 receptor domain-containing protein [Bacteroidota bacterium]